MLALKSSELEGIATSLTAVAGALHESNTDRLQSWQQLETMTSASSLIQGFIKLVDYNRPTVDIVEQMHKTASTLFNTADFLRTLEGYVDVLEKQADKSITLTVMLRYIASLSSLLDLMCAREINALCTAITPEPLKHLGDFGTLPASAIHEFHLVNAPPEIRALAEAHPDMQILEAGDGSLVASFGDIDKATAVTTIVAGVGSSNPEGWNTYVDRARTVSASTGSATVLWLGYQAPSSIPAAASGAAANRAASDLQGFQAALQARNPNQRKVVMGYSYGSTVVGKAASSGELSADALVLVGSPGAGVSHSSQLGAPVYAVTGSADPIGFAGTQYDGIHGTDPTSALFGATVWDSSSSHSGYWNDQEFLGNVAEVVRGK